MRLASIRLSGFKSFVEPTHMRLPGKLIGIVGPNGCGKSNIIDAILWVMGESSAKHLRGESLQDIIFNGSADRKPIGQALVELVFDNSDKKIGGQYASFNEISIKRVLSRDGDSSYFLNGTRCRRRDITDIFLGTGLGARSYAIIEQGMISRLIEAKPDELRVFIEEAAGISKYRARRRETENRLRHTKDNIERLNDIQGELHTQLQSLKRQVKAAERYKDLQQTQQQLNADVLAIQWREMSADSKEKTDKAAAQQNLLEAKVSALRHIEADIETQKTAQTAANQAFNAAQSAFYEAGSLVSQQEQNIAHNKTQQQDQEAALQAAHALLAKTESQQITDQAEHDSLAIAAEELTPGITQAKAANNAAQIHLQKAEQHLQSWQGDWDSCNAALAKNEHQQHITQTEISHITANLDALSTQKTALNAALATMQSAQIETDLSAAEVALQTEQKSLAKITGQYADLRELRETLQKELAEITTQLNDQRADDQKKQGRLASLEALQRSTLPQQDPALSSWLNDQQLQGAARLAQTIGIEPKWTHALEVVLAEDLQNLCVSDLPPLLSSLQEVPGALRLSVLQQTHSDNKRSWPSLADKLLSDPGIAHRLRCIYLAEDWPQALEILAQLQADESVITPSGIWLAADRIIIKPTDPEHGGILRWEQEIQTLQTDLVTTHKHIKKLESQLHDKQQAITQTEQTLHQIQQDLQERRAEQSKLESHIAIQQAALQQTTQQQIAQEEELAELDDDKLQYKVTLSRLAEVLTDLQPAQTTLQQQKQALQIAREEQSKAVTKAKAEWQQSHEARHSLDLQFERISSQQRALAQTIARNATQIIETTERCTKTQQQIDAYSTTLDAHQQRLTTVLQQKIACEKTLTECQKRLQDVQSELRHSEEQRLANAKQVAELRAQLEQAKLQEREYQVKLQAINDALSAKQLDVKILLEALAAEANIEAWQEKQQAVEKKIANLGPINLAAIDEFAQRSERKDYLDRQADDLTRALTTLENAIKKIDKETQMLFQQTFEQLNLQLKILFPKLFGGGQAYLKLTDDDLLHAGVIMMARPPGKKNASIYQLSGGEKALTALAMVFAIFQLNPAPFCILDEVDAPLDDANVSRFRELVRHISKDIQFLFITHNKITMELAEQLIGVTMREAGVSRLVSVDIDKAIEMAATG